jgi:glyoxylase-like metal-dependent hydrolase (beta-lactamase superfamily II)
VNEPTHDAQLTAFQPLRTLANTNATCGFGKMEEEPTMKRRKCKLARTLIIALGIGCTAAIRAQTVEQLPDYVTPLAEVKAKAPVIDPLKGYLVQELKPNIYMITEGAYESVFVTTGKGVVLFDAPPSFARHISEAVAETSAEPIKMLVYSHMHVDHIGGAGLISQQHPKMEILAEEGTAEFLREMHDPHRPVPTQTFRDHYTLRLGSLTANMTVGHWHCPEGDLLISIPDRKFLIAIDAFSSGATPFMDLDLTMNMHEYLKFFDQLEAMDFDIMVPGHHSTPATKEDVEIAKSYVTDVYNAATRVLGEDHQALKERAIQKYGPENGWAIASVLIDSEVNECAQEIKSRWIKRLEGVDIWAPSHCRTALVYAEWDVGSR